MIVCGFCKSALSRRSICVPVDNDSVLTIFELNFFLKIHCWLLNLVRKVSKEEKKDDWVVGDRCVRAVSW